MNNINITRKTLDAFEVTLVELDAILDCCGLVISSYIGEASRLHDPSLLVYEGAFNFLLKALRGIQNEGHSTFNKLFDAHCGGTKNAACD